MKRLLVIVGVLAVAFAVGYSVRPSGPQAPPLTVEPADPPTTQPSAPDGETSERGLLVKELGEVASFGPENGELMVSFAIDAIMIDPECTSTYADPAENGHLVRIDMRLETTAELKHDQYWMLSTHDFTVVGPDGITETNLGTSAAYACLDRSERLPSGALSPSSKYRGSVVIDTRSDQGVLTLQPAFVGSSGGWEWRFTS